MTNTGDTRVRGVVITPAEAANEGVEPILDTLQGAGANAVAVSPGVFVPGTAEDGVREPPLDIDGEARVLDRPLWGRKVQYLKGFSPYVADPEVWRDVPFAPPVVAPEELRVDHAEAVVATARARGMGVFIIVSPTVLPGLPGGQSFTSGQTQGLEEDRLVRVDGSTPTRSIAGQGCVNNPRVRALAQARLTDTLTHYPDADGLLIDWVEYTCYLPEDVFTCFCRHCDRVARAEGFDWDGIRAGVTRIAEGLRDLKDADLLRVIEGEPAGVMDGLATLAGAPEWARAAAHELLRFKARSVVAFHTSARALADGLGSTVEIGANGFAPPWNAVTGADFGALSSVLGTVRCKLFTFHWPMMTRWMGEWLAERSPGLSRRLVLDVTKTLYQVPTPAEERREDLEDYTMPGPDQPHPITMPALTAKLAEAGRHLSPPARLEAYLHAYRPADELARVLAATGGTDGTWIQRYGYLSDRKMEVIRDAWQART
ncbi:hypothetical protein GCM10017673_27830 [Streptosporangium violaceochromogenes]|nr:hypothetical protein GCM10017673_27830 [Streptosporangium violaceochromogenes]